MKNRKEKFYLIHSDILPEAIFKTVEAKRLLETEEVKTVNEAVEKVELSRSAFYKYKDKIFPFNAATFQQIITISLLLEHQRGVLSKVLKYIAQVKGNILTINQSIPLQGVANVVLSIDTVDLLITTTELIEKIQEENGVKRVVVVGHG